jgi:hypothetical protein
MVPVEGDEHLCPAGTSLDVLERFVRAKMELLLRHYSDPEDATNFRNSIEGGIGFVNGPMTPPAQKDFMMRYRDHELGASSALEVTTEQMGLVEKELQIHFGFRRLLPSPRRLGLIAIENGKIEGYWIRLIIESALANFFTPPIFTTEESRKLRKLLKSKPINRS